MNNVTVLHKSVHAVRQCIEKGSFSKITSFSMENEYHDLVQFSSLELNSPKNGHESLLQPLLHDNQVELKAGNVSQYSRKSRPILNEEQPEAVENSEIALKDPDCIARAHPTAALSDSDPGLLSYRGLFWLLHTLDGLVSGYWTK